MCMGTTHARHGLATAATAAALLPPAPAPTMVALIIAVTGMAILPDVDHPEATIAHSFGPISGALSRTVHAFSEILYTVTASGRDQDRDGGHRGITHTLVFAAAAGAGANAAVRYGGQVAVGILIFLCAAFALHTLCKGWARDWGWLATTTAAAALGGAAYLLAPIPPAHMGYAVAVGCLVHCAGDMLTIQGCPLLWPLPLGGRRWHMMGTPRILRFRTGKDTVAEVVSGWVALLGAVVVVAYVSW